MKEKITQAITFGDPEEIMKELESNDPWKATQAITFGDPEEIMKELESNDPWKVTQAITFGDPEEIMKELESNDPWKATQAITLGDPEEVVKEIKMENQKKVEEEVIQPNKIEEPKKEKITKPITFYAKEKNQFGKTREVEVQNSDLGGCIIPSDIGVKKIEQIYGIIKNKGGKEKQVADNISKIICGDQEKQENLANYILKPLVMYKYVDRTGKTDGEDELMIEILIGTKNPNRKEFKIKCKALNKITQEISKKFPEAILYDKKEFARSQIENALREQLTAISTIYCYKYAGWQKIKNKYIYVHKSAKISGIKIMTGLNLPYNKKYTQEGALRIWEKATTIYLKQDISAVLLTYAFLGVSYKLFDEAGYPPHFLLFLTGKTGSMKTTIAKILYMQLMEDAYREYPRRIDADTQTSFERALVLNGADTVTLIDDYAPNKTKQTMNSMKDNLEMIIRMVGDGSTKSRSNANLEDCRGEGVKGMVALTGELKGNGLSSNLRCLFCEIEKENVDLETVTWFQQQKNAFTTLIFHFTNFLKEKWTEVQRFIELEFNILREQAAKFLKERRLIDTLVTLWIMNEVIKKFLVSYCGGDNEKFVSEMKQMQSGITEVVIRSELLSRKQDIGNLFMQAATMMQLTNKLKIKNSRFEFVDLEVYDGFIEDSYIYFLPDNFFHKIDSWLRKGKMENSLNMKEVEKTLAKDGYLELSPNGNGRTLYARIYIKNKGRVNFLKFPITEFEKFQYKGE